MRLGCKHLHLLSQLTSPEVLDFLKSKNKQTKALMCFLNTLKDVFEYLLLLYSFKGRAQQLDPESNT